MAGAQIIIFSIIYLLSFISAQCNSPWINQIPQSTWVDNEITHTLMNVQITNTGVDSLRSVVLHLDAFNSLSQIWEMTHIGNGYYILPQWRLDYQGIPKDSYHTFGYIVRSAIPADFKVSSFSCLSSGTPTIAPPTVSPTSTPGPITPPVDLGKGICKVALVVDSYVTRHLQSLTHDQIISKYTSYFSDINLFYQKNFNLTMELSYIYAEGPYASFTDRLNGQDLLDDFRSSVASGGFPNIPSSSEGICLYHLISGRNPPGIGGLAWVGTACSADYGNTGFTIDGQGNEPGSVVIGRAIHEIGHTLGGNHPDAYPPSKGYTCSTNEDRASDRILKRASQYEYLSNTVFISDCATNSINAGIPSYTCLRNESITSFPYSTMCSEQAGEGRCITVQALSGTSSCYNILSFNDQLSSFSLFPGETGAKGLRLYEDMDCLGDSQDFLSTYLPYVGDSFNDRASSFRFVL